METLDRKQIEDALRVSEDKYRALFDLFSQGFCICEMLIDANGKPYDYRFLEVNQLFEEHTGLKNAAGKTALELVPNLEPHWFEIYGKVALTGEPLRFEQGSAVMGDRWFDVYAFRFGPPAKHQFAIVFNDISERKQAEDRAQVLRILASSLSNVITWEEITEIIIRKGIEKVAASGGVIAIMSENGTHLDVIGTFGHASHVLKAEQRTALDHPTALIALAVRATAEIWNSRSSDDEIVPPLTADLSQEMPYHSWAVMPFNISDELVGVIGLGFAIPRRFDSSEQSFLLTLTEYCAQALHRAKLTEQIGPLAAAGERQRLSRDLHDSVKQLLFASSLLAEGLPRMWERTPERAKKYTDDIVHLNRGALAELQSLLLEMRPQAIVTSPFMTLVKNLCNGLRGHKAITIAITYDGPDELYLPADTHIGLYRLIQETLNNVNKHSEATELAIDCLYANGVFQISIRDNGKGFDLAHTPMGFGMNTMRERAQAVDASFEIVSTVGEGTHITVEWPSQILP